MPRAPASLTKYLDAILNGIWLTAEEITQSLMTVGPVTEFAPGKLQIAAVTLAFDPALFTSEIEPATLTDSRLRRAWPPTIYRLLLRAANPPQFGILTLTVTT